MKIILFKVTHSLSIISSKVIRIPSVGQLFYVLPFQFICTKLGSSAYLVRSFLVWIQFSRQAADRLCLLEDWVTDLELSSLYSLVEVSSYSLLVNGRPEFGIHSSLFVVRGRELEPQGVLEPQDVLELLLFRSCQNRASFIASSTRGLVIIKSPGGMLFFDVWLDILFVAFYYKVY